VAKTMNEALIKTVVYVLSSVDDVSKSQLT
jgi:hypothetical protein